MARRLLWWTEPGPALAVEAGRLRAVVRPDADGACGYLVLRCLGNAGEPAPPVLLLSGAEGSVRAAMAEAERLLARLGAHLHRFPGLAGGAADAV